MRKCSSLLLFLGCMNIEGERFVFVNYLGEIEFRSTMLRLKSIAHIFF